MQTYSMGTVAAAVLLLFFVSYAWQPVEDNSIRMIELPNAKPDSQVNAQTNESTLIITQSPESLVTEELEETPDIIAIEGESSVDVTADLIASQRDVEDSTLTAEDFTPLEAIEAEATEDVVSLPSEYDQLDATVELQDDTVISELVFANSINQINYAPETPGRIIAMIAINPQNNKYAGLSGEAKGSASVM